MFEMKKLHKLISKSVPDLKFFVILYMVKHSTQGAWWCVSVIPTFGRLRPEDHEFEASLGYTVRPPSQK
jgi:hypothetical protein